MAGFCEYDDELRTSYNTVNRAYINILLIQNQSFLNCGQQRSAGSFGRKSITKVLSDTERMKNTHIYVYAKTYFIG
jgi:hypothetical protein